MTPDNAAELVRIYSTGSIMDGYIVKGRLEAEGISVHLKGEAEGPYRMGPVYLFVSKADELRARGLLESVAIAEPEGDEAEIVESFNGDEPSA